MIFLDFSSLVLMEKDKESNLLVKEIGSYEVNEGAEYINKMFSIEGEVNVFFDTKKDVEEWEYSAIYDLFNEEKFKDRGFDIEFEEDEFNPTWVVKFPLLDDYNIMKDKINELCSLIEREVENAFESIKGKEQEYE